MVFSRRSSILHKLVVEVVGHRTEGNVTNPAQDQFASYEYLVWERIRNHLQDVDPMMMI